MDVKFDINKTLENDNVFIKAVFCLVFFVFFISPGAVVLTLGLKAQVFSLELIKIVFFSLMLSIPLNFLGGIVYLHPYKTLLELIDRDPIRSIIGVFFGSCLWGTFSGCGIYFIVNKYGEFLFALISEEVFLQYIAVYFGLFSFFGFIFMINATRFLRKIGYEK